ncbi:MAG: PAC2 family protein [Acidimicrobiales bacterium]
MSPISWHGRPRLRRPIMVAAFRGWNDAGEAATSAVEYLARRTGAEPVATLDPEDFYDFTVTRPEVRLVEGRRSIVWPGNIASATSRVASATSRVASATSNPPRSRSPHDAVFLQGVEPQLHWRAFAAATVEVATSLKVELVVTLGALLADVAHTRPVRVTGSATNDAIAAGLGLTASTYEGPTGIIGVIHEALEEASVPAASLWANVPHYLGQTPSPKAALELARRASTILGSEVDLSELEDEASQYAAAVNEAVATDDDVAAYVADLEARGAGPADPGADGSDQLAREVALFLREHDAPPGAGPPGA